MVNVTVAWKTDNDCNNETSFCYGNGVCTKVGDVWSCWCHLYYNPGDNCKSLVFNNAWSGQDAFLWIIGIVLYVLLCLLIGFEFILRIKAKKCNWNLMVLVNLLLLFFSLGKIIDNALWANFTQSVYDCPSCTKIMVFFIYFPDVIGVLTFKICVLNWYHLVLKLSFKTSAFTIGRNLYIAFSITYALGGIVLIVFMGFAVNLFRVVVIYWIIIPMLITCLHSLIQVRLLTSHLEDLKSDDPSILLAQRKNTYLAIISINFLLLFALAIGNTVCGQQQYVNYWLWLGLYFALRLVETIQVLLFFMFSQLYTSKFIENIINKKKKNLHSSL